MVDNGFKSTELLQFEKELEQAKKQVCFARWAFIIALITLLITLGFNFYGTVTVESKPIEKQLNQIIIQQKIPDVIMTKITNDTLKVKVLKRYNSQQNE